MRISMAERSERLGDQFIRCLEEIHKSSSDYMYRQMPGSRRHRINTLRNSGFAKQL